MYNPFNQKNKFITEKDVKTILSLHECSFNISNLNLFQTAMVHTSYVIKSEYISPTGEPIGLADKPANCLGLFKESYERLEHLGDSILGACVSTYLLKRFPTEGEGFLTDLKKEIVCNEMLGSLSMKIGLYKFYVISRHNEDICNGRTNAKKLGDILEAFIGALWSDSNDFSIVYKFVISLIEKYIDIPKILMNNRNFKEQLQRHCQTKLQYTPTYIVLSSVDGFVCAALDNKKKQIGIGKSQTKKQAEQLAAQEALKYLVL